MADTDNVFLYDAANEILVIEAAKADAKTRRELVHRLAADEFLVDQHRPVWAALRVMSDEGLEYTDEAMRRLVLAAGGSEEVVQYAAGLRSAVPQNLKWHLETLAWDATRARVLKSTVPELLKILRDPQATAEAVVSAARSVNRGLDGPGRRHMHTAADLYRSYRAEVTARRAARNVFPLGAECFDANLTEGFMPGRMTVSAGLPGAGKSTVWMAFAIRLAMLGRRPMYCAWEMDAESLLDVGCSHMTGIDLRRIVQGQLTDEETDRVDKASRWIVSRIKFMGNPFFDTLRQGKKPSNERNLDVLEGYVAESGCDVAVYDLWERMLAWRKPEDVTTALYRMQGMHTEYGLHGVVIQQLNLKDVERRADKRPTRDSIKGSGAYVEVADLIFGVHRDAQFKAVEDNGVETICLKQRKGRANWNILWAWDGATCRVNDPREVSYDPGLDQAVADGDIGAPITDPAQFRTKKKKPAQQIGRRDQ